MWPFTPPEIQATGKPMTWWRTLVAGGILILAGVGAYFLDAIGWFDPGHGLILAIGFTGLGLFLLGNGIYRLVKFGRYDSGYDPKIDDPLEKKIAENDEGE